MDSIKLKITNQHGLITTIGTWCVIENVNIMENAQKMSSVGSDIGWHIMLAMSKGARKVTVIREKE